MDGDPFDAAVSLFAVFDDTKREADVLIEKRRRENDLHEAPAVAGAGAAGAGAATEPKRQRTQEQPQWQEEEDEYGEELPAVEVVVEQTGGEAGAAEASATAIGRVTHTVCVPRGMEVTPEMRNPPYPPARPARAYPFELDPFQKMSVAILERGESVLVSAHTSAGKTVVAEYAIAMGLRDQQRVIYTSPLKALSNQKFRELDALFGDVGLMTGDVTLNPTASCIVMTTEILRSMLYRGSEVMREVATVVFDEIHYMRDPERGVVWEETIILLPQKVKYVFLSATIPNAEEFAGWIAHTHKQACHVVYTDVRPVPLQHYVFPAGGAGLHLVVDDKGRFREDNFQKAIAGVQGKPTGGRAGASKEAGHSDIFKIVSMVMAKNYDPVIVFAFSKRDCEALALQMGKLSFTTEDEKKLTRDIFANAIEQLSEDDKSLPQIQHVLPLLQKGIGIHHSGLLPLIKGCELSRVAHMSDLLTTTLCKEVIEILFQEGLIKCLFATETFAMGLNMPAHTAVFSSVRKFDGKEMRWISGGEYVQMSGRAGRRGKDERGIVILMVDEKMEPEVAKGMLKGSTQPLVSAFHITYSMLLNLMRVEGVKPEMLINSSFAAFQAHRRVPELQAAVDALRQQLAGHTGALEAAGAAAAGAARELVAIRSKLEGLRGEWEAVVLHPVHAAPFLQPGRLARLAAGTWGAVVACQRLAGDKGTREDCVAELLLPTEQEWTVQSTRLSAVSALSSLRIPLPPDLRSAESRASVGRKLEAVCKRFAPHGPPLLDPVEDMNIRDNAALERCAGRIAALEALLLEPRFAAAAAAELFGHATEEARLGAELAARELALKESRHAYLAPDLKRMRRVLRRLGFTTEADVIDVKGRVACELQASDELLLVEMLFNGLFNTLSPPVVAALLSCFVFDAERKQKEGAADATAALPPALMRELGPALRTMQSLARRVATVMQECRIEISPEEYVSKFSPAMANVVFQWATGAKFVEICKLTAVFEGAVIRCMRRLEEVLRQLMQASKAIGNAPLEQKFAAAIAGIKRDIVFSASLYL